MRERGEYGRLSTIERPPPWAAEDDQFDELSEDEEELVRKFSSWHNKQTNTQLITAILSDAKIEDVRRLFQSGVSPLVRCQQSMATATHLAALKGRNDIIQCMLEECSLQGITASAVLARDSAGRQPHHLAASRGHLLPLKELVRVESSLVDSQVTVDPNLEHIIRDDLLDSFLHDHVLVTDQLPVIAEGSTALHIAAKHNYVEMVRYLISKGANANMVDSEGFTPLDVAGLYSHPGELLRTLSTVHLERHSAGSTEILAFENTATDGDVAFSPLRCDNTSAYVNSSWSGLFSPKSKSKSRISLFDPDALSSTMNVVTSLVKGGGRLSQDRIAKRTTPLHKFVEKGDENAIKEFLSDDIGFSLSDIQGLISTRDSSGRTPIHLAVEMRLIEPLKLLLQADKSVVNMADLQGRTPLHIAVENEWLRGIEVLLEQDIDLSLATNQLETVVHIAARKKNPVILKTLIARGSRSVVNKRDAFGFTALFRAIEGGSIECVSLLLDCCRPRKNLSDGTSLVHVAVKANNVSVLRLLAEKIRFTAQDLNRANPEGLTPLHVAVKENSLTCLEYLISMQPTYVNVVAEREGLEGGNILHLAAQLGRHEALRRILAYDFAEQLISSYDRMYRQPLILAAAGGYSECVALLIKKGANLAAKDRNTEKTALELIHYNVPHSSKLLTDLFDSFMVKSGHREDSPDLNVILDYRCLLADIRQDDRQLGVIEAFIKCNHETFRQKLFLHPLTESFLNFKWNQMKIFFRMLIFISFVHICALTTLSVITHVHRVPLYVKRTLRAAILVMNLLLFFLEYLHSRADKTYLMDAETWVKWSVLVSSTVVSILPEYDWLRYLTAVTVLLSWIQLLFLIARNPRWGLRVLMFFEVSANVFQVLTTFLFLIVGFAFAFLILFDGRKPFTDIGTTLSKVFIMMVELDYNGVYGAEPLPLPLSILGRLLYLGFVLLVVMVLTNLIVGMSVSDVTELETQGTSKRIAKQASFLVVFEKILYSNWWSCCLPDSLHKHVYAFRAAPNTTVLWPNKKKHKEDNPLPDSVRKMVLQRVLNMDDRTEEDSLATKVQNLSDDVQEMFKIIREIKESIGRTKEDYPNNWNKIGD